MQFDTKTDVLQALTTFANVRAVVIFFICLFLTAPAFAGKPGAGVDLTIETTPAQLLGSQQAARYAKVLAPDKPVSWQVYLPPADTANPPGVLVYVSPMETGVIDSRWREVMDAQNLIYVAANDMGNQVPTIRRMVMANLAVKALAQRYVFDTRRIYVSGFSGGGKVASLLATQYPEVFSGAIYICGVDFWKEKQTPNLARVLENRFVFLTGSKDFNRMESRRIQQRYVEAGAQHTRLIVVPGMAHKHPDANYLTEALTFLDGGE